MARIERFTSRVQAEVACGWLTAQGIDARVSSDDANGAHPDIPFGIGGTAIVVPDGQLAEASSLLDEQATAEPLEERVSRRVRRRGLGFVLAVIFLGAVVVPVVVTVIR